MSATPPSLFRFRPDDLGQHFPSTAEIELVELRAAMVGRPDQLAPLAGAQQGRLVVCRRGPVANALLNSRKAVEVRVDNRQFVVVTVTYDRPAWMLV